VREGRHEKKVSDGGIPGIVCRLREAESERIIP
jgi:hypothetical protein